MNNIAFIVVDFINEFVNGKVSSPRATKCIKPAKELISFAHKHKIPVIFTNDTHDKKDRELKIWGEHSLKGSEACEIYKELNANKNDIIIPKHTYSAFYNTKLKSTLKKLNIKRVAIFGLYATPCVKYTLVDAFFNDYDTYLVKDAIEGFTKEAYVQTLSEIKTITDTKIVTSKQLIEALKK